MGNLQKGIKDIQQGDLFYIDTEKGQVFICQAMSITRYKIFSHTLCTRYPADLERSTGAGVFGSWDVPCRITSVAPLPPGIAETLVQLDRRHTSHPKEEDLKLSQAEIDALCMLDEFYAAHPLPDS